MFTKINEYYIPNLSFKGLHYNFFFSFTFYKILYLILLLLFFIIIIIIIIIIILKKKKER